MKNDGNVRRHRRRNTPVRRAGDMTRFIDEKRTREVFWLLLDAINRSIPPFPYPLPVRLLTRQASDAPSASAGEALTITEMARLESVKQRLQPGRD